MVRLGGLAANPGLGRSSWLWLSCQALTQMLNLCASAMLTAWTLRLGLALTPLHGYMGSLLRLPAAPRRM